jgi:hypothetical protein
LATWPVSIGETGETVALEPAAPQQHRHLVHPEFGRNPFIRNSVGCGKYDPGTHRQALLGRSGSQKGLKRSSLQLADRQWRRWMVRHAPNRSCQ